MASRRISKIVFLALASISILFFRYYFSMFHPVMFIKLLLGSLPSVVAPEIIRRILADGLFQHLEEAAGYLMLWQGVGLSGDELVSGGVVASLRTAHLHIEHGIVHLPHDAFASRKHRGLGMVEERQPKVDVLPLRSLVADVAEDAHDALALVIHEIAEDVFLGHYHAILLVGADVLEEFVESMVAKWVINQSHHAILR